MANLNITAADVRVGDIGGVGARITTVKAGETITPGQVVYKKDLDKEWYLADADGVGSTTGETAGSLGIGVAMTNAGDGEAMVIQTQGVYGVGSAVVTGEVYVLSDTPGAIRLVSDAGSGDITTILGVASSTTEINLRPNVSGYQRA